LLEDFGVPFIQEFNVNLSKKRDLFDFYIPSRNLLIECDSKYWHTLPHSAKRDAEKTAKAIAIGYAVVRLNEETITSSLFREYLCQVVMKT
jgi:very-short-patch-repair endonuclease